jgi:hypothetical protein
MKMDYFAEVAELADARDLKRTPMPSTSSPSFDDKTITFTRPQL